MNRRGFLKGILASGVAPYVVTTAGVLMPVRALSVPRLIIRDSLECGLEPDGWTVYLDDIQELSLMGNAIGGVIRRKSPGGMISTAYHTFKKGDWVSVAGDGVVYVNDKIVRF